MVTKNTAARKRSGKRCLRKLFPFSPYLWREPWAGCFGTVLHATGHTPPPGTRTRRKREALSNKSPQTRPDHKSGLPEAHWCWSRNKHQRAGSLCRSCLLGALPTAVNPPTIGFHQVTSDSQINSSSSPPTPSWQLLKDRIFIKKPNSGWAVSVWKWQTAPVQPNRTAKDDSRPGYFCQHYSHNPLSCQAHLPARQAETRQHLSGAVLYP